MGVVTILPETTKYPITLMGERAGICWNSNIANDDKNYKRGMDCIKSQHGRVMEYVNVEMILNGYSARVIREWYTHLGGSPTRLQSSTRYIDYTKDNSFDYVVPPSIQKDECARIRYINVMKRINNECKALEKEFNIPREDAAMCLPLGMTTKIVDKRNLRNLVDMSKQRMCSRAYWEYRELFKDICDALREVSNEWEWIVDNLFHPKCDDFGYCPEKKSCGRYKNE